MRGQTEGVSASGHGVEAGWRWLLTLVVAAGIAAGAVAGDYAVRPVASFGVTDQVGAQSSASMILGSDGAFYGTTYAGAGAVRGTVFKLSVDGSQIQVLHRFTGLSGDGAKVYGSLVEASPGVLYGTTGEGGVSNRGTIFRLNCDGSDYQVVHSFTGAGGDGSQAFCGLTLGSDGMLYGVTRFGGSSNHGTLFRLKADGTDYRVLHSFAGTHAAGAEPVARVIEGPDGRLYGTTYGDTIEGTVTNRGTVFSINRDGTGHTRLRAFTGQGGDGAGPYAELALGRDGRLYGSTSVGGDTKQGILYRLRTDGSEYQRLHSFGSVTADGGTPYGPVLETADGTLYGMTSYGGSNGVGRLFSLRTDGSDYRLLRSFVGDFVDGAVPFGGFVRGADGWLYGTTWYGGPADAGTVFRLKPEADEYEVIHLFTGGGGDGVEPYAGLIRASDGALYGTSWSGGRTNRGSVYRVRPNVGEVEVVHHFGGWTQSSGEKPYSGVVEGSDGKLYGTTVQGGMANSGALFRLNKDGSGFELLRSFVTTSGGGYWPYGGVIEGSDGLLYGTLVMGGSAGYGLAYRIGRTGSGYDVLRNFRGGTDGAHPYGGLMEGSDGWVYGVTAFGGGANRGTVFKMRRNGDNYTVLRRFSGSEDGRNPYARLLEGSDGLLYGTTSNGGRSDSGMVFRLAKSGSSYQVLYGFDGTPSEGINALGGLSLGPGGMIYGSTALGGQWGQGTLYRLNTNGTGFEVLHHFRGEAGDGGNPSGELVAGDDGLYYGTSRAGGIGCGQVFRLEPRVSLAFEADGRVRLSGPTGLVYAVQSSVEATSAGPWTTFTNFSLTSSPATVALPGYGTRPKQFVRTVLGP